MGGDQESTSSETQGSAVEESNEPAAEASAEGDTAAFPTSGSSELNLYNCTDYISPDLLKRFESETEITVNLDNYDSNVTLLAKLQAGGTNYDLIVPIDYMVALMIDLGLLEPVKPSSFPNGANIKPEFLNVYFDQSREYTAPYMYGITGIAVDSSKTSKPVTSWADFFATDNPAGTKVGTLNDQVEVVHASSRAVGSKPCSTNRDDYIKMEKLLQGWKPTVAVINYEDVISRMASGQQVMHMTWDGAFTRAQVDNAKLEYIYPTEGLNLWQDNFAIPKGAQNVDNAKIFINWMMDPKNIAEGTNFVGDDNGITGSSEFMTAELGKNPAVVIPDDKKILATPAPACPTEAVDLYDQVWTGFKK